MSEIKTKKTKASVEAFLNKVEDKQKREDCFVLLKMMEKLTKDKGSMWGDSIVGFGTYSYTNSTGKPNDWFHIGFSPRKANLTLYVMCGYGRFPDMMSKLGKYKTGMSCLYINKLSDVDVKVLEKVIDGSLKLMKSDKWKFDYK